MFKMERQGADVVVIDCNMVSSNGISTIMLSPLGYKNTWFWHANITTIIIVGIVFNNQNLLQ